MITIAARIAQELSIKTAQANAAIALLDEGATVPFIARYRKEKTGALDDTQLRQLDERLRYLRELDERRDSILDSIREQGKLGPELEADIRAAETKSLLEDLYLPFKPKRRTKGQIALEAGLEALANQLFDNPFTDPQEAAAKFLNPEHKIETAAQALEGARFILMERFSEHAKLLQQLKDFLWQDGEVRSEAIASEQTKGQKFKDYFDYREKIAEIPSHRALALFRGRNEGILSLRLEARDFEGDEPGKRHPCEIRIAQMFGIEDQGRAADKWLAEVVRWTWKVKLHTHIETDLLSRLKERAEATAIQVFADNLKDLLLAAPAGPKVTIGLDPGLRTGVKVAVVDRTGKVLDHTTIYPHAPHKKWDQSIECLAALAKKHAVELISIGNGTASRETEKLAAELSRRHPALKLSFVVVSEAGASVYSASETAAREFPDLDVTIRGAVSIARRLQDPLAELVKIDPKAIGVGQYQHDVSQIQLGRSLDSVIEDCVNAVGVDLNTASAPLLSRVSGLNPGIAANVVALRDQSGAFRSREELRNVPRLGAKAFEQCAGFLRISHGDNPLDASAVHPESYTLVERIAQHKQQAVEDLIGNQGLLAQLAANDFISDNYGEHTVKDVLAELAKPGRDPRPEFRNVSFKEGVETLADLRPEMILEGVVTNVTHFGAFVDIGVHQDGLVHISALAERFVKDPREVVKTGDIVKVKVMEVDTARKRIALSMRLTDAVNGENKAKHSGSPEKNKTHAGNNRRAKASNKERPKGSGAPGNTGNSALRSALAAALEKNS
ncbi:MAG: RNA-binding transcriptional accessory protein [Oleiphilus sp.]|nr:MAG: RNA-binding transcriptional accessory protein [Oleiphilus sp.]